jgi:D-aminopeptidase
VISVIADAELTHLWPALRHLTGRAMRYVCKTLTAQQASMLYLPALHEVLKL